MAEERKGLWCPTRGYITEGGGGAPAGGEGPSAPEPAAAAEPAPAAPSSAPSGAAPPGTRLWCPTRGFFTIGGGAASAPQAPPPSAEAAPAAPREAPKEREPAQARAPAGAPSEAKPAESRKTAPPPVKEARKAPPPAEKKPAAPPEPESDPLRESVAVVEPLVESPVVKEALDVLYDEPDSEITLYRVPVLNKAFAITSLILLLCLVLVFWQDYDRQWKRVQGDWEETLETSYRADLDREAGERLPELAALEPVLLAVLEKLGTSPPELPQVAAGLGPHATFRATRRRVEALLAAADGALEKDPGYRERKYAPPKADGSGGGVDYWANLANLKESFVRTLKGEFQAAKFEHEEAKRAVVERYGDTPEAARKIEELERRFIEEWVVRVEEESRLLEELQVKQGLAQEELDRYVRELTAVEVGGNKWDLLHVRAELGRLTRPIEIVEKSLREVRQDWRNAPLIDFLAPTYTIKKVVLPDLREDLNFLTVPRIDRCKTCHINIDDISNPRYAGITSEKWGTVYRSHPRTDLFLSGTSPHPYEQFGCTVCHYGDGHALEFTIAAHTPNDEYQEEEWKERYDWHELHHQDYPMLAKRYVTASCGKCHADQVQVEGAGRYNLGKRIVRTYGCFGCHRISGFDIASEGEEDRSLKVDKVGPSLRRIAEKTTPAFLYAWIRNPWHYRPSTQMPRFFDNTNNRGVLLMQGADGEIRELDFDVRNAVEALALATFLYDTSEREELPPPKAKGDPKRGRALVQTLGCLGCHSIVKERQDPGLAEPAWEGKGGVRESLLQAAQGARAEGGRHAELASAYDGVRESLAVFARWLAKLSIQHTAEELYHRTQVALARASALEEALSVDSVLEAPRRLAEAYRNRWVHNTFAPDLSAIGSKFDLSSEEGRRRAEAWLTSWILDPSRHDPKTVMPRFRLREDPDGLEKVADIVAYLLELRDPEFEKRRDEALTPERLTKAHLAVLDEIALDYLRRNHTRAEARELLAEMDTVWKLRYVGHRLVRRYGCFGCHNGIRDEDPDPEAEKERAEKGTIAGFFDTAQPIGTELNGWGIKPADRLDFGPWGYQHKTERWAIAHNRYAWAKAKLSDTRRFDVIPAEKVVEGGRVVYEPTNRLVHKTPEELLKMPLFPFHDDEEQVEAVVTFLASLVKDPIRPEKRRELKGRDLLIERGGRLVEKFNCAGCHRIGTFPRLVHVSDLPLYNDADPRPESIRRNEWEKETWLARTMRFQGKPIRKSRRKAGVTYGVEIPSGTLLNTKVLDPTTMDPRYDAPVSVVELAKRHYDPLPGFLSDVLRIWDEFVEEEAKDPELKAFLDGIVRNREDPHWDFVVRQLRSFAGDPRGDAALGAFLQKLRERPYEDDPDEWPDTARRDIPQWEELARRYYGEPLKRTPKGLRVLPVRAYQEGQIRFYFGTDATARSKAPPPLVRQGERVRSEWLFHFLLNVEPIRPWLKARMPSFRMSQEEARIIVGWFKALSELPEANELFEEDRFDPELAELGRELFLDPSVAGPLPRELLVRYGLPETTARRGCNKCHPSAAGLPTYPLLEPADRIDPRRVPINAPDDSYFIVWEEGGAIAFEGGFPTAVAARQEAEKRFSGRSVPWAVGSPWSKATWGPDLSLARSRLRPPWVRAWLENPPDFMPGTAMPNFFGSRAWFPGLSLKDLEKRLEDPNLSEEEKAALEREIAERRANNIQIEAIVRFLMHMSRLEGAAAQGGG